MYYQSEYEERRRREAEEERKRIDTINRNREAEQQRHRQQQEQQRRINCDVMKAIAAISCRIDNQLRLNGWTPPPGLRAAWWGVLFIGADLEKFAS